MHDDKYYTEIVLPVKGFNLWCYLSQSSPLHWDFEKVRRELQELEEGVRSVKGLSS